MMQGDSYCLEIKLKDENGDTLAPETVSDVEISVGHLTKTYASGEVTYDTDNGLWLFPVTQEETFRVLPSKVKVQARVKFPGDDVVGVDLGMISISESISKVVL